MRRSLVPFALSLLLALALPAFAQEEALESVETEQVVFDPDDVGDEFEVEDVPEGLEGEDILEVDYEVDPEELDAAVGGTKWSRATRALASERRMSKRAKRTTPRAMRTTSRPAGAGRPMRTR